MHRRSVPTCHQRSGNLDQKSVGACKPVAARFHFHLVDNRIGLLGGVYDIDVEAFLGVPNAALFVNVLSVFR